MYLRGWKAVSEVDHPIGGHAAATAAALRPVRGRISGRVRRGFTEDDFKHSAASVEIF